MPVKSCKNILVVGDDIDIYNLEALVWALDYRLNPMENRALVLPDMPSGGSDPSAREKNKDAEACGGRVVNRTIIDATKNWSYGRKEEWDNDFYPPVNRIVNEEEKLVERGWKEYEIT